MVFPDFFFLTIAFGAANELFNQIQPAIRHDRHVRLHKSVQESLETGQIRITVTASHNRHIVLQPLASHFQLYHIMRSDLRVYSFCQMLCSSHHITIK